MSAPDGSGESPVPGVARELGGRARSALRMLVGRQAVLQLLAIAGGIVVARVLGPEPLGVFGIAFFVVMLAGFVADLGTRTALIRQERPVGEVQLATCFTLQQALVTLVVIILFATAPAITSLYAKAPPDLAWLIRLLAVDLYLRSWRSISEIRLERELRYRELAVSDIAGSSGYQLVAVGLVVTGSGVESLVWATLVGNVVRVSLLYRAAPWPFRFALDQMELRQLLATGIPLEFNRLIGLAPSWITPTLAAALLGPEAVGLLTWASTLGRKPLELLDNVVRVSLTHFSRLQRDRAEVERLLIQYATASVLATGLWFVVMATVGSELVAFVYTESWLPAMPALVLYAGSAMMASVRGIASAAIIGLGRVRLIAWVSLVASLVAIATSALLVLQLGLIGVPLGQFAGILVATPWLLRGAGRSVPTRVLVAAFTALWPLLAAGVIGRLCLGIPIADAARVAFATAMMTFAYLAVVWWAGPGWLRAMVRDEVAVSRLAMAWRRSK